MRSRILQALVVGTIICVMASACSSGSVAPETADDPEADGSFEIGFHDLGSGRSRAVGVLAYSDLEGGFWALFETAPGSGQSTTGLVAVIANMESIDVSPEALAGKVVAADGVLFDGVSIRMAGPEIIADDVYEVPAE